MESECCGLGMCSCLAFLHGEPQPGQGLCFKQASVKGREPPSTLTEHTLRTLLSVFRALSQSILTPTQGGGYFIVSILKVMKPQLTEIK